MASLASYDWTASADRLSALMRPHYEESLTLAHSDAEGVTGVSIEFGLSNPHTKEVIDGLCKKVKGITDTTREDIRMWIDRGTEEGLSIKQIAEQIRSDAAGISQTRAETIAVTETASAYTGGSLLYYADSGVVSRVEWLTTDPCPICAPLDGQRVALGEQFDGGYDGPPAHPNCRCALAPISE